MWLGLVLQLSASKTFSVERLGGKLPSMAEAGPGGLQYFAAIVLACLGKLGWKEGRLIACRGRQLMCGGACCAFISCW
jgi:hypothetical protein